MYSCHEGFQLVGVEKTYCQASGRWSGSAEVSKCRLFKEAIILLCRDPAQLQGVWRPERVPLLLRPTSQVWGGGPTEPHCIPTTLKNIKMSIERDPDSWSLRCYWPILTHLASPPNHPTISLGVFLISVTGTDLPVLAEERGSIYNEWAMHVGFFQRHLIHADAVVFLELRMQVTTDLRIRTTGSWTHSSPIRWVVPSQYP